MKKLVLAAAALAGLSMIAMPASAQGFIGASFGKVDVGVADADAWSVHGAGSFAGGGGMRVLVDGAYSDWDDVDVQTLQGTGHLVWDNAASSWGAFLGLVNSDSSGSDSTTWIVGGEYAAHMMGGTFVVGAGYGNNDDADADLFGINGEYRLFASDNTRIDLNAALFRVDGTGGDADGTSIGIGIEHLFAGGFSAGAAYNRVDVDDFGLEADIWAITGRFNFGGQTLAQRNTNGNTFNPLGGFGNLGVLF
jgi:hypothetical protein